MFASAVTQRWTAHANRANNIPYTVRDGTAAPVVATINQRVAPVGLTDQRTIWQDLSASLPVNSGTLTVSAANTTTGFLMADAMRIERIGSGVTGPVMATMRYAHDALGRRVSRTDTRTGLTEIMVGPVTSRARQEARSSSLQQKCEPNTRRRTTGTIAELIRYTPYGEPTFLNASGAVQTASPTGNRLTYTGREYDAEAKGYYFRHRWYSAGLGRFVGRDPLMYPDGPNTYAGWFGPNKRDPDGRIGSYGPSTMEPLQPGTDSGGGGVFICFAPMAGHPASLPQHCWLRTSLEEGGMYAAPEDQGPDGELPSSPCLGTQTEWQNHEGHSSSPGATCTRVPVTCNESCISAAISPGTPTGTWGVGNNCQTLVTNSLRSCGCINPCLRWTFVRPVFGYGRGGVCANAPAIRVCEPYLHNTPLLPREQ